MSKHIVVIGGGMAGTAAANTLLKQGYRVTVVEKNHRLGGRIYSETVGDLTSEMGAGFLTGVYTQTLAFLKESGLSDKLFERTSDAAIMRNGRLRQLSRASTFWGSSWLSAGARLLLLREALQTIPVWRSLDLHDIWKVSSRDTESVAQHFKGKYGRELVDYAIGPAIDSYLYWSPERTSYAVAIALIKASSAIGQRHTYILRGGLSQIPEAAAKGCKVLLSHEVKNVQQAREGGYDILLRHSESQQMLKADGVVCATTASIVPAIIGWLTPKQQEFFAAVHYSSTTVATYRVERSGEPHTYAVAFPHKDGSPVTAMTVLADLSPEADVVKLYASGAVGKELCAKTDKAIEATLSGAINLDLETARKTKNWRVQRWPEALPEFEVGHLKRLRTFVEGSIESQDEPLVFAGDYIGGPFIDGAFTSGVRAAQRLNSRLKG